MTDKLIKRNPSRRDFLLTSGAMGLGGLLGSWSGPGLASGGEVVPRRDFGRTGRQVSVLSLGGIFDTLNNQIVLQQALNLGVTYWDTAESYLNGRSERGIGRFLQRNPDVRARIFLVTKAWTFDPRALSGQLEQSLKRLQTSYVDLFFIHAVNDPDDLTRDHARWAEGTKAAGKIKLFGFSIHANMAACLKKAAGLGWIDGVMTAYNFRLLRDRDMQAALEVCAAKGVGLTAMKTLAPGYADRARGGSADDDLTARFLSQGFSQAQARLKAVWQDARIASICSQMPNLRLLKENAAAAADKTRLSAAELDWLARRAELTASSFCLGCGRICEEALGAPVPVSEVMRCLMYWRGYHEPEAAQSLWARLASSGRAGWAEMDFSAAEKACPRGLEIGRLMREAVRLLA